MQGSDEQESLREDNEQPVKRQADMGAYVLWVILHPVRHGYGRCRWPVK